jgi:putative redox protein
MVPVDRSTNQGSTNQAQPLGSFFTQTARGKIIFRPGGINEKIGDGSSRAGAVDGGRGWAHSMTAAGVHEAVLRWKGLRRWGFAFLRGSIIVCGMVTILGKYETGLRCHVTHEQSGSTFFTDAPLDNHGQGRSFSPTDLVATALGACMMTVLGIRGEREGVNLSGSHFRVTKEMTSQLPRKIARLGVDLHLPAGVPADQRERLEAAARGCPVHHSLHPDVACEIRFHYDV